MGKDLIILVADKDMEMALHGILSRNLALGINESLSYDIYTHPNRDAGCRSAGVDFLRSFIKDYRYALLLFDHHGSGAENNSREDLETNLERDLNQSGWDQDHAKVVVLAPELEIWVWSDSPEVAICLGWQGQKTNLRDWLIKSDFWNQGDLKPHDPKGALKAVREEVKKRYSSATFKQLAERVSFNRCQDESFLRLKEILQDWFK